MTVVMCEGGYRNVKRCYMRNTGPDPFLMEYGLDEDVWTLFDEDGRKCVCASDRNRLFFWITKNDIALVAVH